jgi:hypothetical protein
MSKLDKMNMLIQKIQQQQQSEKDDINKLNQLLAEKNSGKSGEYVDNQIYDLQVKINKTSTSRMLYLNDFMDTYEDIDSKYNQKNIDLNSQLKATKVIEQELNLAKENYKKLNKENNDDIRMIEINTYYEKRYRAHTKVMKLIFMIVVPIIVLAILAKKDFLPSSLVKILITIITVIGSYFVIKMIIDLSLRDNMDYDKYDWENNLQVNDSIVHDMSHNNNDTKGVLDELSSIEKNISSDLGTCFGDYCCGEGTKYNEQLKKCIPINSIPQRAGASSSDASLESPIDNNSDKIDEFPAASVIFVP